MPKLGVVRQMGELKRTRELSAVLTTKYRTVCPQPTIKSGLGSYIYSDMNGMSNQEYLNIECY